MATVTGLTALRMLAIEAASVVDGLVVGDELHLTTHGGDTIVAGNVRGPQGLQGIQGIQGIQGVKGDTGDPAIMQLLDTDTSAANAPSTYPTGISYHSVGVASAWPITLGTIVTVRRGGSRTFQMAVRKDPAELWLRSEGNGDAWSSWIPVGILTPHIVARASSAQNIPGNTWTNVGFSTLITARGGFSSSRSPNTDFVVPVDGMYFLSGIVRSTGGGTGLRYVRWTKNGVEIGGRSNTSTAASDADEINLAVTEYGAVGDIFRCQIYCGTTVTIALSAPNADATSYGRVTWIGP